MRQTGRELDVAIAGNGYFQLTDLTTGENLYTRSGHFEIERDGAISLRNGSQILTIDPAITVPFGTNRVAVHPDGKVQVTEVLRSEDEFELSGWTDIGSWPIARFQETDPFQDPLALNRLTDETGTCFVDIPNYSNGILLQGWLEERPSILPRILIRILFAIIGSVVLYESTCFFFVRIKKAKAIG